MSKNNFKLIFIIFLYSLFSINLVNSEIVKNIEVVGNDRISNETIKTFANVQINQDLNISNIIWASTNRPHLIDWDFSRRINPTYDIIHTALFWSGFEKHFNIDDKKTSDSSFSIKPKIVFSNSLLNLSVKLKSTSKPSPVAAS